MVIGAMCIFSAVQDVQMNGGIGDGKGAMDLLRAQEQRKIEGWGLSFKKAMD